MQVAGSAAARLGGQRRSYYILSLGQALFDAGVQVVRLNLRDHGDTHHLNQGIFHSCRLEEVCGAIAAIGAQHAGTAPWLIGFSLGGNFMLRVAASQDPRLGPLAGVVAVSPVLHPDSAMLAMEQGLPVYQRYFVHKWNRSLRRKQSLWPGQLNLDDISAFGGPAAHDRGTGVAAHLLSGHEGSTWMAMPSPGRRLRTLLRRRQFSVQRMIPSSPLRILHAWPRHRCCVWFVSGTAGTWDFSPVRLRPRG